MGNFIILQDLPAEHAALDFGTYASTLSQIIRSSNPRFAIGIFGGWGAGKTTLMHAISRELTASSPSIVTVDFSAWRYEREPNLIVPMLDVIREALVKWAAAHPMQSAGTQDTIRTLGRAVKAFLAGFAFKAGLPGAAEISFEASKAIDTWDQAGLAAEETARSLYHACFTALGEAFESFAAADPDRRIVVFVDDLDRCLPNGAMEVIEAMKLFFDLPGFVFVVGLDQKVIEAAVELRYRDFNASLSTAEARVSGEDYIKKIFQVPFSLAPVSRGNLDMLVNAYLNEAGAPDDQKQQVWNVVLPHLRFMAAQGTVNPRDVKRYINAFTITSLIRPTLDKNVILTLQTISYRPDWRHVYRSLLSFRSLFLTALNKYQAGNPEALEDLDDDLAGLSQEFAQYVTDGPGKALLAVAGNDIAEYLYAGEATRMSGDPAVLDIIFELTTIRARIKDFRSPVTPASQSEIGSARTRLKELGDKLNSHLSDAAAQRVAKADLAIIDGLLQRVWERAKGAEHFEYDWNAIANRLKSLVPKLIVNY
jgi:hypothetical protein